MLINLRYYRYICNPESIVFFSIIDLGVMVSCDKILKAATEHNAGTVKLSYLCY